MEPGETPNYRLQTMYNVLKFSKKWWNSVKKSIYSNRNASANFVKWPVLYIHLQYINILLWAVSITMGCLLVYGIYTDDNTSPLSPTVTALYNATARSVWGACVAWVIFACANGYGGKYRILFLHAICIHVIYNIHVNSIRRSYLFFSLIDLGHTVCACVCVCGIKHIYQFQN